MTAFLKPVFKQGQEGCTGSIRQLDDTACRVGSGEMPRVVSMG